MFRPVTPHDVLDALRPWVQANLRPSWKPHTAAAESGPSGSRFGGAPYLPEDGVRPGCGHCNTPLRLVLQLDLATLPEGTGASMGDGLLQVFSCGNDCAGSDDFSAFSSARPVRIVRVAAGGAVSTITAAGELSAKAITGWKRFDDEPSPPEQESLGLDFVYDFTVNQVHVVCPSLGLDSPPFPLEAIAGEDVSTAAEGDKLLGWPHWVQGVEYPDCSRCAKPMRYLFQFASNDNVPLSWGDSGTAYVSQCVDHLDVLTLAWAGN